MLRSLLVTGNASSSRAYSAILSVRHDKDVERIPSSRRFQLPKPKQDKPWSKIKPLDEFPLTYPEFLQSPAWNRRVELYDELVRADMFERRINLVIPEFYVGSIVAVTLADKNLEARERTFLGICIRRERIGLFHTFTLRNHVNGLGCEMMYNMYSPDVKKIDVLKLEKRLDDDMSYLVDALPEYSTIDFDFEPVRYIDGKPPPLNPLKVIMKPPPWSKRWELMDLKGVDDASIWSQASPFWKKKFIKFTKDKTYEKYDLIQNYREDCQERENEQQIMYEMLKFEQEKEKKGIPAKGRLLRSITKGYKHKWFKGDDVQL